MAERTVTVRLKALVDDYKRAMGQAGQATADVARQADNWSRLGRSTADLGDRMTRNVTLPIVAVGAAAVKMAADFDSSFVTMTTLAGVSTSEVEALKESVLGLAGEVGRSPQELAEALYFLRSSGLDSAAAMDALEMSAKASAAGLGSTIQIADAVSSAMNAYAQSGLSAAEATDVLVATARAGKAEPAELAAQMGRVLPIASELGVQFHDVGAAIAALSLGGNDAAASTTQLMNVLMKMIRPSQQGAEALEAVGISVDDLEGMIAEKGLLGTLEELRARLGDSGFRLFLEDAQAITAGLALTGENVEQVRGVFEDLSDTAGDTESAFGKWAESMGADNARAFADFQVALIRLGETLAPIVSDIMGFAAGFAEAFSKLPDGAQKAVIAGALVVAALGPIMSVGGRVITVAGALSKAIANWVLPAGTVSGAFTRTGAAATTASTGVGRLSRALTTGSVALAGWVTAGQIADEVFGRRPAANVSELENALLRLGETGRISGELQDEWHNLSNAIGDTFNPTNVEGIGNFTNEVVHLGGVAGSTHMDRMGADIEALDQGFAALVRSHGPEQAARSLDTFIERMAQSDEQAEDIRGSLDAYDAALAEVDTAEAAQGTGELGDEMGATADATGEATSALQQYVDTLLAQFDPMFAMVDALTGVRDAQGAIAAAELELIAAREEHGASSMEAVAAEQALVDARNGGARAAVDLHAAATELNDAIANEGLSAQAAAEQLVQLATDAGFSGEEALRMAENLLTATGRANELGATDPNVELSTSNYGETRNRIQSVRDGAMAIPTYRNVAVSAAVGGALGGLGEVERAAGRIPRNVNVHVTATGDAAARIMAGKLGGRASGGQVGPGWAGWVGEQGRELLMLGPNVSGHVFTEAQAQAAALSMPMASAASGGLGGGDTYLTLDMRGSIVADSYQFQGMVASGFNRALRDGQVNVRSLAVRR